jgi:hypothetical protein
MLVTVLADDEYIHPSLLQGMTPNKDAAKLILLKLIHECELPRVRVCYHIQDSL